MTITSKLLAIIVLVTLFGGIAFSSVMGWWVTESTKEPVTFTEGEFAGQANPADIRGSYTFGDIAESFDVTPEILAQAFGITEGDPSKFAVKELEAIYTDSGFEIGTTSVRLFVAYYSGLPFDTTDQEIYMPQSATDILVAKGNLKSEQIAYLEAYTVGLSDVPPGTEPLIDAAGSEEFTVKGKTTFGELIAWGVSQQIVEQLIGAPMPDPALSLKDYATANGLDFETLKIALQAEVDKVTP
ncbi:MAG TPA: hypothetical protein VFY83_05875 [Anaerolineales bacterium]|nr:hypothetical protein [Anaerolineales bacterium]